MPTKLFTAVRGLFRTNWELKLLALLLGAMSFYAIRGTTSFEVPYNVPLEVKVEKGIAILDQDPLTVDVTFRGSQQDLSDLDQRRIRAVVTPRETDAAGSVTVPVTPGDVTGAAGVRVVKVRPNAVSLTFDRETEKKVAVRKPEILGRPLIGKAEAEYEPRFVTIRGPRRRLKDKESVSTEPVDVDGRVESFSKKVRVLPPGDAGVSQIEPAEVTVKVSIVTESVSREFEDVPVLAVIKPGRASDVYCEPAAVVVSLRGRAELLENLQPDSVTAFVDCTDLTVAATYELPVQVHLPPQVDVNAETVPKTVTVFLK